MDSLDRLLEVLMFENIHDELILMWGIVDVEQNLIVQYLN